MKTKFLMEMAGALALLLSLLPLDGYGRVGEALVLSSSAEREEFGAFVKKFTSSAAFQYTRVKFPLKTPIVLLAEDETEKSFPFTREKWPLLDGEMLKAERFTQEDGAVYVSRFTLDEPERKVFEAGYEESEPDLRVEFERQADGKWYVVDCYTGWYGFDLPAEELEQAVESVREENEAFKELHP